MKKKGFWASPEILVDHSISQRDNVRRALGIKKERLIGGNEAGQKQKDSRKPRHLFLHIH